MKFTLYNNFHNTAVTLNTVDGTLTARQVARAKRTLCGRNGCTCSNELGVRGPQDCEITQRRMDLWVLENK